MQVVMNKNARTAMMKGINILADAVEITLGPKGRNVVIKKRGLDPQVTKDGVTVAKAIELDDFLENSGAEMVKEVASRANSLAGDGTTTATVLAREMIVEGLRHIDNGANPIDLKRGMDKAVLDVIENLNEQSKECPIGSDLLNKVSSISANNDSELGELIAEAFQKVGETGVVTVEDSRTSKTYVDVVKGMQFNRGYLSPYFITNPDSKLCQLENPMFLLCDRKITNMLDIIPAMELAKKVSRPLVVIAEDVDGQALAQLTVNVVHGSMKSVAIKAPGFSESRYDMLTDIATITRSVVFSEKTGFELDNITEEMFGSAEGINVEQASTVIVNGRGAAEDIHSRVVTLEKKVSEADSEHEIKQLRARIAKMSSGVGVVYVGANSPVEAKEKRDRADDALCATRAAIEEGIVEGGGVALLKARNSIKDLSGDEKLGADIIYKSAIAPLKAIVRNAGCTPEVILSKLEDSPGFGYDAKNGAFVSMFESGIVDPKKVTRVALENASSVAGMVLLTECAIIE